MTEQPDTTKVRALGQLSMTFPELRSVVFALCDALDAARAERDKIDREHNRLKTTFDAGRRALLSRAEAAEADLGRWQDKASENLIRAKAAEATLTRAENAWRGEVQRFKDDAAEQQRRAEAAEADYERISLVLNGIANRADAAEARIAAALDVAGHDFYQSEAQRLARDVRRALTE